MTATRQDLFECFDRLGIVTTTREHPAVFTVAESTALELAIPGGHTKNLFLANGKGDLFLVVAESDTAVDLKAVAGRLGAGRFSFGKPELLAEILGVTPGSVTAFAVINDRQCRVRVVIDSRLMRHGVLNAHPLENTATTSIARDDLLRFIRAQGHEPLVLDLTRAAEPAAS